MKDVRKHMDKVVYRKACIEDCYAIAQLKRIVWNTTYKGIYPDEKKMKYNVEKNKKIFQKIIQNPDIDLYVAVVDKKIVGFMTCGKPYRPFLYFQQEIGLLYILKEYQRRGIGKNLFRIARQQVEKSGYSEFFVSVNKYNYAAQEFYIAMGGNIIFKDESQIRLSYTV